MLKDDSAYEISILLKDGGLLTPYFEKLCKTWIWNVENILEPRKKRWFNYTKNNCHKNMNQRQAKILKEIKTADIIINNTIANGELLALVNKNFAGKIITYVHELNMGFSMFATASGIAATIGCSDRFAVPSLAVKEHLKLNYSIVDKDMFLLPYYIPKSTGTAENLSSGIKKIHNENVFIIGGCGTPDWRKGIDIFIAVAIYIKAQNKLKGFKFLWKGVVLHSPEYNKLMFDINKSGLAAFVELLPSDDFVAAFYDSLDVFLLTSREDPYPLVVLEAAGFGKPSICFQHAGGAPEFIQDDAGSSVPYLDVPAMGDLIISYKNNISYLQEKGMNAQKRLNILHRDDSVVADKFKKLIDFQ